MTDRVPDANGDVDVDANRDATPLEGAGEDDDEAHTPAPDEEDDEDDGPPQITTIPRRRGRGRGPGRPPKSHLDMPDVGDDGSESGTPFKRKRGRPVGSGRGGFRGRRKGAPPEAPHVMFEGTKYDVVNDEAQIDQDDEGDEKVDENGHLLGGREYRVRTFTIEGRGEKLYMLSTEPARCCGFRDSYLFFTKHPKLYKVLVNDAEKKDLIEREVLPSSYKGRNIGVVVARSVFREFGARIIVGGRRIIDDYKVSQARADGFVEGELADPDDAVPGKDEQYNRNRYVAWFGASEVYRNTAGAGAPGGGKPAPIGGKRRNNITLGNWQTMHASDARYVQVSSDFDSVCTNFFTVVSTPSWQPTAEQHTLAYTTLTRT
jgi:chromatin structure-remodeling complex protein RSC7